MANVSVIVPIYNGEKTISKCLDSILSQSINSIEVVCVNDGSTDKSLDILESYAKNDVRIKIVNKENGGLVSAKKAGVNAATSEYIGFVDCDDWIDNKMYEELYHAAKDYDADLVCSGYYLEGNYITEHYDNLSEGLYADENMLTVRENIIYDLQSRDVGIRAITCSKLFRRSIFKNIMQNVSNELTIAEDKVFLLMFVIYCQRVYILKSAFYHYILNQGSMSHSQTKGYLLKVNEIYDHIQKLYSHKNFTETMRLQAELYITELLYKGINSRLGFKYSNLFWIDPYYIDKIPVNSKIVLYGDGELGETYKKQISHRTDLEIMGCVPFDKGLEDINSISINKINEIDFDYILITIKNKNKAASVISELKQMGVHSERILWFEQKEIYWRCAETLGYLD